MMFMLFVASDLGLGAQSREVSAHEGTHQCPIP